MSFEQGVSRRQGAFAAGLAFLLALALHQASALHDTDSYFHLAIARLYAEQGVVDDLPALRLSLLRDGYGDKEFLFHAALVPLVEVFSPLWAGRVALALWSAAIAGLLAALAARPLGPWAWTYPLLLAFASTEWTWRLVRLRPELLALALFLLAAWALAGRRDRWLAAIAFAFALGYTAIQALLGLIGLTVLALGMVEAGRHWRAWRWPALLYSMLGAGLGLIVHPHFPKNLTVWWVQNVRFFTEKAALDVGTEIRPNTTDVLLMVHLGLFAGLVALALAARPAEKAPEPEQREDARRHAVVFATFAGAFLLLYLLMSRFSIYAWPFATLAFFHALEARGKKIGGSVRLPGHRSLPLAAALALALLLGLPEAWRQLGNYRERTALGPDQARIRDREALASRLPPEAKVAADWGPTATYLLWAPQARFLNALDPIFMALPYPDQQTLLRQVLDGESDDVPGDVVGGLDSDYLAFPRVGHEKLLGRLEGDPRVFFQHQGSHVLAAFGAPAPADAFVVDWGLLPAGAALPALDRPAASWPRLPQPPDTRRQAVAGYLPLWALGETRCRAVARELPAGPRQVELAVRGRARVWLGQRLLASVAAPESRLADALLLPLAPEAPAVVTLEICATRPGERFGGFWRERPYFSTEGSGSETPVRSR